MGLLDGIDGVTLLLQVLDSVQGVLIVAPFDTLFGTQCGLMYLCVRRTATDAAQHHALDTHRVGGTKDSTYIMLAPYVIEHHNERYLVRLLVLRHTQAIHLCCA